MKEPPREEAPEEAQEEDLEGLAVLLVAGLPKCEDEGNASKKKRSTQGNAGAMGKEKKAGMGKGKRNLLLEFLENVELRQCLGNVSANGALIEIVLQRLGKMQLAQDHLLLIISVLVGIVREKRQLPVNSCVGVLVSGIEFVVHQIQQMTSLAVTTLSEELNNSFSMNPKDTSSSIAPQSAPSFQSSHSTLVSLQILTCTLELLCGHRSSLPPLMIGSMQSALADEYKQDRNVSWNKHEGILSLTSDLHHELQIAITAQSKLPFRIVNREESQPYSVDQGFQPGPSLNFDHRAVDVHERESLDWDAGLRMNIHSEVRKYFHLHFAKQCLDTAELAIEFVKANLEIPLLGGAVSEDWKQPLPDYLHSFSHTEGNFVTNSSTDVGELIGSGPEVSNTDGSGPSASNSNRAELLVALQGLESSHQADLEFLVSIARDLLMASICPATGAVAFPHCEFQNTPSGSSFLLDVILGFLLKEQGLLSTFAIQKSQPELVLYYSPVCGHSFSNNTLLASPLFTDYLIESLIFWDSEKNGIDTRSCILRFFETGLKDAISNFLGRDGISLAEGSTRILHLPLLQTFIKLLELLHRESSSAIPSISTNSMLLHPQTLIGISAQLLKDLRHQPSSNSCYGPVIQNCHTRLETILSSLLKIHKWALQLPFTDENIELLCNSFQWCSASARSFLESGNLGNEMEWKISRKLVQSSINGKECSLNLSHSSLLFLQCIQHGRQTSRRVFDRTQEEDSLFVLFSEGVLASISDFLEQSLQFNNGHGDIAMTISDLYMDIILKSFQSSLPQTRWHLLSSVCTTVSAFLSGVSDRFSTGLRFSTASTDSSTQLHTVFFCVAKLLILAERMAVGWLFALEPSHYTPEGSSSPPHFKYGDPDFGSQVDDAFFFQMFCSSCCGKELAPLETLPDPRVISNWIVSVSRFTHFFFRSVDLLEGQKLQHDFVLAQLACLRSITIFHSAGVSVVQTNEGSGENSFEMGLFYPALLTSVRDLALADEMHDSEKGLRAFVDIIDLIDAACLWTDSATGNDFSNGVIIDLMAHALSCLLQHGFNLAMLPEEVMTRFVESSLRFLLHGTSLAKRQVAQFESEFLWAAFNKCASSETEMVFKSLVQFEGSLHLTLTPILSQLGSRDDDGKDALHQAFDELRSRYGMASSSPVPLLKIGTLPKNVFRAWCIRCLLSDAVTRFLSSNSIVDRLLISSSSLVLLLDLVSFLGRFLWDNISHKSSETNDLIHKLRSELASIGSSRESGSIKSLATFQLESFPSFEESETADALLQTARRNVKVDFLNTVGRMFAAFEEGSKIYSVLYTTETNILDALNHIALSNTFANDPAHPSICNDTQSCKEFLKSLIGFALCPYFKNETRIAAFNHLTQLLTSFDANKERGDRIKSVSDLFCGEVFCNFTELLFQLHSTNLWESYRSFYFAILELDCRLGGKAIWSQILEFRPNLLVNETVFGAILEMIKSTQDLDLSFLLQFCSIVLDTAMDTWSSGPFLDQNVLLLQSCVEIVHAVVRQSDRDSKRAEKSSGPVTIDLASDDNISSSHSRTASAGEFIPDLINFGTESKKEDSRGEPDLVDLSEPTRSLFHSGLFDDESWGSQASQSRERREGVQDGEVGEDDDAEEGDQGEENPSAQSAEEGKERNQSDNDEESSCPDSDREQSANRIDDEPSVSRSSPIKGGSGYYFLPQTSISGEPEEKSVTFEPDQTANFSEEEDEEEDDGGLEDGIEDGIEDGEEEVEEDEEEHIIRLAGSASGRIPIGSKAHRIPGYLSSVLHNRELSRRTAKKAASGSSPRKSSSKTDKLVCTFTVTGDRYENQHWYHCVTCGLVKEKGCCGVCAKRCHKGHDITYARQSRFFCDCGASTNCTSKRLRESEPESDPFTVALNFEPVPKTGKDKKFSIQDLLESFSKFTSDVEKSSKTGTAFMKIDAGILERFAFTARNVLLWLFANKDAVSKLSSIDGDVQVGPGPNEHFTVVNATTDGCFQVKRKSSPTGIGSMLLASVSRQSLEDSPSSTPSPLNFSKDRILAANSQGHLFIAEGMTIRCVHAGALLCDNAKDNQGESYFKGSSNRNLVHESALIPQYRMSLSFVVRQIEFNPVRDSFVAIVGEHNCFFLVLSEKGGVQSKFRLELALGMTSSSELQSNCPSELLGVAWLPGSSSRLLVVANSWMKVFDVASDTTSPTHYFEFGSQIECFTIVHPLENPPSVTSVMVALKGGEMVKQDVDITTLRTPVPIPIALPWRKANRVVSLHAPIGYLYPCLILKQEGQESKLVTLDDTYTKVVNVNDSLPKTEGGKPLFRDDVVQWLDWVDQQDIEQSPFIIGMQKESCNLVIGFKNPRTHSLESFVVQELKPASGPGDDSSAQFPWLGKSSASKSRSIAGICLWPPSWSPQPSYWSIDSRSSSSDASETRSRNPLGSLKEQLSESGTAFPFVALDNKVLLVLFDNGRLERHKLRQPAEVMDRMLACIQNAIPVIPESVKVSDPLMTVPSSFVFEHLVQINSQSGNALLSSCFSWGGSPLRTVGSAQRVAQLLQSSREEVVSSKSSFEAFVISAQLTCPGYTLGALRVLLGSHGAKHCPQYLQVGPLNRKVQIGKLNSPRWFDLPLSPIELMLAMAFGGINLTAFPDTSNDSCMMIDSVEAYALPTSSSLWCRWIHPAWTFATQTLSSDSNQLSSEAALESTSTDNQPKECNPVTRASEFDIFVNSLVDLLGDVLGANPGRIRAFEVLEHDPLTDYLRIRLVDEYLYGSFKFAFTSTTRSKLSALETFTRLLRAQTTTSSADFNSSLLYNCLEELRQLTQPSEEMSVSMDVEKQGIYVPLKHPKTWWDMKRLQQVLVFCQVVSLTDTFTRCFSSQDMLQVGTGLARSLNRSVGLLSRGVKVGSAGVLISIQNLCLSFSRVVFLWAQCCWRSGQRDTALQIVFELFCAAIAGTSYFTQLAIAKAFGATLSQLEFFQSSKDGPAASTSKEQEKVVAMEVDEHQPLSETKKSEEVVVQYCCDRCNKLPLVDVRWQCTVCQDFDLCSDCKGQEFGEHHADHEMVAIDIKPNSREGNTTRHESKRKSGETREFKVLVLFSILEKIQDLSQSPMQTLSFVEMLANVEIEFLVEVLEKARESVVETLKKEDAPLPEEWLGSVRSLNLYVLLGGFRLLCSPPSSASAASTEKTEQSSAPRGDKNAKDRESSKPHTEACKAVFQDVFSIKQREELVDAILSFLNRLKALPSESFLVPSNASTSAPATFPAGATGASNGEKHSKHKVSVLGLDLNMLSAIALCGPLFKGSTITACKGDIGALLRGNWTPRYLLKASCALLHTAVSGEVFIKDREKVVKMFVDIVQNPNFKFIHRRTNEILGVICQGQSDYRWLRNSDTFQKALESFSTFVVASLDFQMDSSVCNKLGVLPTFFPTSFQYDELCSFASRVKHLAKLASDETADWHRFTSNSNECLGVLFKLLFIVPERCALQLLRLLSLGIGAADLQDGSRSVDEGIASSEVRHFEALVPKLCEQILVNGDIHVVHSLVETFVLRNSSPSIRLHAATLWRRIWQRLSSGSGGVAATCRRIRHLMLSHLFGCFERVMRSSEYSSELLMLLTRLFQEGEVKSEDFEEQSPLPGLFVSHLSKILNGTLVLCEKVPETLLNTQIASVVRLKSDSESSSSLSPADGISRPKVVLPPFSSGMCGDSPCVSCKMVKRTYKQIPLKSAKSEMKFSSTTMTTSLDYMITIDTIHVDVTSQNSMFGAGVQSIVVSANSSPASDLVSLSSRPQAWQKIGKIQVEKDKDGRFTLRLPVPVSVCNLMFEYETTTELTLSQSSERQTCPRCNRAVTDRSGVCSCGEVVFQCRHCRRINQEDRNAFLCVDCGHCRYAKFSFVLEAREATEYPPILTEADRDHALKQFHTHEETWRTVENRILRLLEPSLGNALEAWRGMGFSGQSILVPPEEDSKESKGTRSELIRFNPYPLNKDKSQDRKMTSLDSKTGSALASLVLRGDELTLLERSLGAMPKSTTQEEKSEPLTSGTQEKKDGEDTPPSSSLRVNDNLEKDEGSREGSPRQRRDNEGGGHLDLLAQLVNRSMRGRRESRSGESSHRVGRLWRNRLNEAERAVRGESDERRSRNRSLAALSGSPGLSELLSFKRPEVRYLRPPPSSPDSPLFHADRYGSRARRPRKGVRVQSTSSTRHTQSKRHGATNSSSFGKPEPPFTKSCLDEALEQMPHLLTGPTRALYDKLISTQLVMDRIRQELKIFNQRVAFGIAKDLDHPENRSEDVSEQENTLEQSPLGSSLSQPTDLVPSKCSTCLEECSILSLNLLAAITLSDEMRQQLVEQSEVIIDYLLRRGVNQLQSSLDCTGQTILALGKAHPKILERILIRMKEKFIEVAEREDLLRRSDCLAGLRLVLVCFCEDRTTATCAISSIFDVLDHIVTRGFADKTLHVHGIVLPLVGIAAQALQDQELTARASSSLVHCLHTFHRGGVPITRSTRVETNAAIRITRFFRLHRGKLAGIGKNTEVFSNPKPALFSRLSFDWLCKIVSFCENQHVLVLAYKLLSHLLDRFKRPSTIQPSSQSRPKKRKARQGRNKISSTVEKVKRSESAGAEYGQTRRESLDRELLQAMDGLLTIAIEMYSEREKLSLISVKYFYRFFATAIFVGGQTSIRFLAVRGLAKSFCNLIMHEVVYLQQPFNTGSEKDGWNLVNEDKSLLWISETSSILSKICAHSPLVCDLLARHYMRIVLESYIRISSFLSFHGTLFFEVCENLSSIVSHVASIETIIEKTNAAKEGGGAQTKYKERENSNAAQVLCLRTAGSLLHSFGSTLVPNTRDSVARNADLFIVIQKLTEELANMINPVMVLPNIYILMKRARSQEDYFSGTLENNPISIDDVPLEESDTNPNTPAPSPGHESSNSNSSFPGNTAEMSQTRASRSFSEATPPILGGGNQQEAPVGEGSREPTMRDLRAKIANDLNYRDAKEIMELIVCGKLINLDLPIRLVYEKLWKPQHQKKKAGTAGSRFRVGRHDDIEDIENDDEIYDDDEEEDEDDDENEVRATFLDGRENDDDDDEDIEDEDEEDDADSLEGPMQSFPFGRIRLGSSGGRSAGRRGLFSFGTDGGGFLKFKARKTRFEDDDELLNGGNWFSVGGPYDGIDDDDEDDFDGFGRNDVPPMEVTYRLCGIDGEATEDFVETLADDEDEKEEKDPELRFHKTLLFVQGISDDSNSTDGLAALLSLIQFLSTQCTIQSTLVRETLDGVVNLLSLCCNCSKNRMALQSLGAVPVLLNALMVSFQEVIAAPQVEQFVIILEQLVAGDDNQALDSSNRDQVDETGHQLSVFLKHLDISEKAKALQDSPRLRRAMARLLPFLTFGRRDQAELLLERFVEQLGPRRLVALDEGTENWDDLKQFQLDCILWSVDAMRLDTNSMVLRAAALESGFTKGLVEHLQKSWKSAEAVAPEAGLSVSNERKRKKRSRGDEKLTKDSVRLAFASQPTSALVLRLLAGLCKGHSDSQLYLMKEGVIDVALDVEQIPAGEVALIGDFADNLLVAVTKNCPETGEYLRKLKEERNEKKQKRALAKRQNMLAKMGLNSTVTNLGAETSVVVADEGANDGGALETSVNASGKKLKKKRKSSSGSGDARKEKKPKKSKSSALPSAVPDWMKQMDDLVDEEGLVCTVCQEGFLYKKEDVMGVYVYSKPTQVPRTVSFVTNGGNVVPALRPVAELIGNSGTEEDVERLKNDVALVCVNDPALDSGLKDYFPNVYAQWRRCKLVLLNTEADGMNSKKQKNQPEESMVEMTPTKESKSSGNTDDSPESRGPGEGSSGIDLLSEFVGGSSSSLFLSGSAKYRKVFSMSTVSSFNCIHVQCHQDAVQADKQHPKAPKDEWEGARLRNAQTKCNNLLPFRGPLSVPEPSYNDALKRYFDNCARTRVNSMQPQNSPSQFSAVLLDLRFLILKFALGESLSAETDGGGAESNFKLIVPLLSMASHLFSRSMDQITLYNDIHDDFVLRVLVAMELEAMPRGSSSENILPKGDDSPSDNSSKRRASVVGQESVHLLDQLRNSLAEFVSNGLITLFSCSREAWQILRLVYLKSAIWFAVEQDTLKRKQNSVSNRGKGRSLSVSSQGIALTGSGELPKPSFQHMKAGLIAYGILNELHKLKSDLPQQVASSSSMEDDMSFGWAPIRCWIADESRAAKSMEALSKLYETKLAPATSISEIVDALGLNEFAHLFLGSDSSSSTEAQPPSS